jgi:hypothetical protein
MIIFKLKFVFIAILFVLTKSTYSQSIIRSSIGCFGNSVVIDNILYRHTAGQSSNTASFINEQQLRQGFQQPITLNARHYLKNNISINLSPNPASTDAKLTIDGLEGAYIVSIASITGNEMIRIEAKSAESIINCLNLSAGMYMISIIQNHELLGATKLIVTR